MVRCDLLSMAIMLDYFNHIIALVVVVLINIELQSYSVIPYRNTSATLHCLTHMKRQNRLMDYSIVSGDSFPI